MTLTRFIVSQKKSYIICFFTLVLPFLSYLHFFQTSLFSRFIVKNTLHKIKQLYLLKAYYQSKLTLKVCYSSRQNKKCLESIFYFINYLKQIIGYEKQVSSKIVS